MKLRKIINLLLALILIPVLLFVISYFQVKNLFLGEYTQYLSSIEVSYISMARFILNYWPHLSWQPLWYFGYPFYLIYLPVLPFLEIIGQVIFGFSLSHSYRFFTALSYTLVPVSLFWLVWGISKSKLGGLVSGLIYASLPSLLAFIFPAIMEDRLSTILEPRRYAILVRWGEGPHTMALVFLPLAALFFYHYLAKGRFKYLVLSSLFISLTFLTNAVALWALLTLLFAITLELSVTKLTFQIILTRLIKAIATVCGLCFFWYHPAFITTFFSEGGGTFSSWLDLFPWGVIAVVVGLLVYYQIVKKFSKKVPGIVYGLTWFILMFGVVFVYYHSGEERVQLVPQALRLNTEADMALAILIGGIVASLWNFLWKKGIILKLIAIIGSVIILILPVYYSIILAETLPRFTIPLEKTDKKLSDTAEYKVAKYLETTVKPGERVLASGNYDFFLNYSTDVFQLRGALYQSAINKWPDHIYYQVTNGSSSEISLAWLKIANISTLIYTTGGSGEVYKDYKIPREKFDQILTEIKQEKGDIYYQVPLKDNSLAKVVSRDLMEVSVPKNAIDKEPLREYVSLLEENPGRAKIEIINNQKMKINAVIKENEAILVQSAYHQGWHAQDSQGKNLPLVRDPLGFIIIDPQVSGNVQITLTHQPIFSQYLGILITLFTLIFIFVYSKSAKTSSVSSRMKTLSITARSAHKAEQKTPTVRS